MQVFGNLATLPERRVSKQGQRGYFQFRIAEGQRGLDAAPTFYTVRVMKDEDPNLTKGDFVRVTGKLKADFYLNREGKPTGNLLVIAFEAFKVQKPSEVVALSETATSEKGSAPGMSVASKPAQVQQNKVQPAVEPLCEQFPGWSD